MRIVISGSSGLIGRSVVAALRAGGDDVIPLVRRPPGPGEARWDPAAGSIDAGALEGADAVVHLAGAGIGDKRWTAARRHEIVSQPGAGSTTLLARTLAGLGRPPTVLVSASAVGFYGDRGDEELTEDERAPGAGSWPRCAGPGRPPPAAAAEAGIRVVHLRSGVVLARTAGPWRVSSPCSGSASGAGWGRGRQWLSWISLPDEVGAILHAIDDPALHGPRQRHRPGPGDQPRLHGLRWAGPCTARRSWPCRVSPCGWRWAPTWPTELVLGRPAGPAGPADGDGLPSSTTRHRHRPRRRARRRGS